MTLLGLGIYDIYGRRNWLRQQQDTKRLQYVQAQHDKKSTFRLAYRHGSTDYSVCVLGDMLMGIDLSETTSKVPVDVRSLIPTSGWLFHGTDKTSLLTVLDQPQNLHGTLTGYLYSRTIYTDPDQPIPRVRDVHLHQNITPLFAGGIVAMGTTVPTHQLEFLDVNQPYLPGQTLLLVC